MRPDGNSTGSGIKDQLGRPDIGEYAILVREAVQNTWDARLPGEQVSFHLSLRRLEDAAGAWQEWLGNKKFSHEQVDYLAQYSPDSIILVISDRGTAGLGGPIRADRANETSQDANFVQFIRNVGEARDTHLGGGTYGFGKGIYYRVSQISALLVDSSNPDKGPSGRRLMGAALGTAFTGDGGQRFTGRHWWGEINDEVPDPVLGDEAKKISRQLGLPGFEKGQTGTDIVVLMPEIDLECENETLESLGERLRGHIYWNLWPKFKTPTRPQGIDFSIDVNGHEIDMPPIDSIPVLREFVESLDNIEARKGTNFTMTTYKSNLLGDFSTEFTFQSLLLNAGDAAESIRSFSPISDPYRHIARMRQAELVVDYVAQDPMQSSDVGYVGTFRASAFTDSYFAAAEPPTHDAWSTAGLTGSALGIVRGSNAFISRECQSLVEAQSGARSKMIQGLGRLANQLGTFVDVGSGSRAQLAKSTSSKSGSGGSPSKRNFHQIGSSRVAIHDGSPVVEVVFEVSERSDEPFAIEVKGSVIMAGGTEMLDLTRSGEDKSLFQGWFFEDQNTPVSEHYIIQSEFLRPGRWSARCRHLPGLAFRLSLAKG